MKIEIELTKKEVKTLKHIRAEREIELTRRYIQNPTVSVREAQREDPTIQLVNRLIGKQTEL